MNRGRTIGTFALVTVLFGTGPPAVKVGLAYLPPLLFSALRSYVAAAVLLGYVALTISYWGPRTPNNAVAVLAGGVFLVGGIGFAFVGQQFITAGVAAIIFSLSPIVTGVLAWCSCPSSASTVVTTWAWGSGFWASRSSSSRIPPPSWIR